MTKAMTSTQTRSTQKCDPIRRHPRVPSNRLTLLARKGETAMFTQPPASVGDKVRCEVDGFTLTASLQIDYGHGAPWEIDEGHGTVSGWTSRPKLPGELVLIEDHGFRLFYDFQEAVKIARREKWCVSGTESLPAGERANIAATADYRRLLGWCENEWTYVGIVVTASRGGVELAKASLWGIESDAESYILEAANELIPEAINESLKTIKQLADVL